MTPEKFKNDAVSAFFYNHKIVKYIYIRFVTVL